MGRDARRWLTRGRLNPTSFTDDIVAKHELGDLPRGLRGLEPSLDAPDATRLPIRRFTEDRFDRMLGTTAGRWAGRGTTLVASETARDLVRWVDSGARKAVFTRQYRKMVPQAWGDLRQEALGAAKKRLYSADRMTALLDEFAGEWGPSKLYADLLDAFGDEGLATHLSRSWASATGRARDKALKEAQRLFFTGYERGGFDAVAKRLFLFHYFASRQTALYATQAIRNPGLMHAYLNAVEGFDRYVEEHDLPESVGGFLRLFGTGYGLQMFVNPALLLTTYLTFRDAAGSGEEQSWLSVLKDTVFLNPLIEAATEYLGFVDDGFLSDPTGLRPVSRLATALYNEGVARGLIPGAIAFSDPLAVAQQYVREKTSGVLPGSKDLPAEDPGAINQDKFFNLIVADALEDPEALRALPAWEAEVQRLMAEEGMTREDAEAHADFAVATDLATQAMMEGPGNGRYDAAAETYAHAGVAVEVATRLGPWGVQTRVGVRDETMVGREVVRGERRSDPNVTYPGTDVPVTPGDTPENAQLGEARGAASTTGAARGLEAEADGAEAVGTPAGREALDTWNDIAFGEPQAVLTIGGTQYSPAQIGMLPDETREGLANLWAEERGLNDDIAAQRTADAAYKAAHPEYAAYTEWRGEVYDHEDGVVGWWEQEAAGGNQAAAVYLAEVREGNPTEAQLIGRLTSPAAYLAAQGVEANLYQDPLPTAQPTGQAPAGQPFNEPKDPAQAIEDEVNLYRAEVAAASVVLIAHGIPPSVFEVGSDAEQAQARAVLATYGMSVPTLSADAKAYVRWSQTQPQGADTSIESFLAWRTSAEAMGAGVTAPFYLDILAGGGDPLAAFLDDPLAMMMAGMGPDLQGPQGGYGQVNIGTRIQRPSFQVGPGGQPFGGYGTRLPR
jgi:hypothetical protein